MTIEAKVICASKYNDIKPTLYTVELKYPRFIHSELLTHRVFSRSSSSSRAIPVDKLTNMALEDPAFFSFIGENIPGMSPGNEVSDEIKESFYNEWCELAYIASGYALRWANEYNIHKSAANRVLEPWHHIKTIVTSTEWENFFNLRIHESAQAEIHELALKIKSSMDNYKNNIVTLNKNEWHLPYIKEHEKQNIDIDTLLKISTARCARVSYMNHDNSESSILKDILLHDKLVGSKPIHASPAEHQARRLYSGETEYNLKGWYQYRSIIEKQI